MKKTTMIAVLTAMARSASSYDDFSERLEHLEKALGSIHNGWMLIIFVDDDVTDPDDPQWYTVTVFPPKGKEYEVDLSEYLKGLE